MVAKAKNPIFKTQATARYHSIFRPGRCRQAAGVALMKYSLTRVKQAIVQLIVYSISLSMVCVHIPYAEANSDISPLVPQTIFFANKLQVTGDAKFGIPPFGDFPDQYVGTRGVFFGHPTSECGFSGKISLAGLQNVILQLRLSITPNFNNSNIERFDERAEWDMYLAVNGQTVIDKHFTFRGPEIGRVRTFFKFDIPLSGDSFTIECRASGTGVIPDPAVTLGAFTSSGWLWKMNLLAEPAGVANVTAVELDRALPDSILDNNPAFAGSGLRVFPDKNKSSDTSDRRKVKVRAITDAPASAPKATVFFKSFDVDDPSSDNIIDSTGPSGDDNRGNPKPGVFIVGGQEREGVVSVDTFADPKTQKQVAEVEFKVTMHPGDNFRIAASTNEKELGAVIVAGTDLTANDKVKASPLLTVWRRLFMELDVMANVKGNTVGGTVRDARLKVVNPGNFRSTILDLILPLGISLQDGRFGGGKITIPIDGKLTPFFIINNDFDEHKKIHTVEIGDLTRVVPFGKLANQAFQLVDDDDYNLDDVGSIPINLTNFSKLDGDEGEPLAEQLQTRSLIKSSDEPSENIFADACIKPVYDNSALNGNSRPIALFQLNTPDDDQAQATDQLRRGRDTEFVGTDDFWVAYFQLAYQPNEGADGDPESGVTGGHTYAVGTSTDVFFSNEVNPIPKGGIGSFVFLEAIKDVGIEGGFDARAVTPAHELGHQMGLEGHAPGFGIMVSGNPESARFVPKHIVILRSRVKSPGR